MSSSSRILGTCCSVLSSRHWHFGPRFIHYVVGTGSHELKASAAPNIRRHETSASPSPMAPVVWRRYRHTGHGDSDDARSSTTVSSVLVEQAQRIEEEQKRELHSVNVALSANSLIFVAKIGAWAASGGSALLAEAIHSLADIGNQAMLRVGILKASEAPSAEFPYGHMRDKFIFSLISAVGIFCLGAGVSIVHGLHSMAHPAATVDMTWGFAALIFSTLVEGCTLLVAIRAVAAGARAAGMRFADFVKSGRDPVSVAIMAEDGAAVAGVIVASVCTALAERTGTAMWDGLGGVLVGLILGGVAIYLIQRNRSFLIGRAMLEGDFQKIVRHLKRDPVIKNIYEAKSEEIGEGIYRFNAEIDFDGPKLLERYMERQDVGHMKSHFARAVAEEDNDDFEVLMKAYGTEVVSLVGSEVDRIEAEVMELVPGVRYVDLETDRGRFSTYARSALMTEVEEVRAETFAAQPPAAAGHAAK
eukprot:jgi/Ulvmu1/5973/UM026_0097.1